MAATIPYTYRSTGGTYYLRYVFPTSIRQIFPRLGRELRYSLRSKHGPEARQNACCQIYLINQAMLRLTEYAEKLKSGFDMSFMVYISGGEEPEKPIQSDTCPTSRLQLISKAEFYTLLDTIAGAGAGAGADSVPIRETLSATTKPTALPAQSSLSTDPVTGSDDPYLFRPSAASAARAPEGLAPATPLVTKQDSGSTEQVDALPQITFKELSERFFSDHVAQGVLVVGDATYRKYTGYMRNIIEIVGASTFVSEITPPRVMEIRNAILSYPVRRFVGSNAKRTLASLVADSSVASVKKDTATEYFDRFKAVLDHGCILGYLDRNPATAVKIRKAKGRSGSSKHQVSARKPFTDGDLINILQGYVYHGPYDQPKRALLDAHFWVPLIAMYTGMRVGEICQLQTTDIHEEGIEWHGREFRQPYIQVCQEHKSQRVKNKNATRKVPIHQNLIKLGFLDYVRLRTTEMRDPENQQLFAGMRYEEHSKWGRIISRWFNGDGQNGYKHQVLDAQSVEGKVFHSFRHTFIDLLRNTLGAGGKPVISALVGHEEGGSTQDYGEGFQIDVLADAINSVRYSDEVESLVSKLSFVSYVDVQIQQGRRGSQRCTQIPEPFKELLHKN